MPYAASLETPYGARSFIDQGHLPHAFLRPPKDRLGGGAADYRASTKKEARIQKRQNDKTNDKKTIKTLPLNTDFMPSAICRYRYI